MSHDLQMDYNPTEKFEENILNSKKAFVKAPVSYCNFQVDKSRSR